MSAMRSSVSLVGLARGSICARSLALAAPKLVPITSTLPRFLPFPHRTFTSTPRALRDDSHLQPFHYSSDPAPPPAHPFKHTPATEVRARLYVDSLKAGYIIGRKGVRINQLRSDYDVNIFGPGPRSPGNLRALGKFWKQCDVVGRFAEGDEAGKEEATKKVIKCVVRIEELGGRGYVTYGTPNKENVTESVKERRVWEKHGLWRDGWEVDELLLGKGWDVGKQGPEEWVLKMEEKSKMNELEGEEKVNEGGPKEGEKKKEAGVEELAL